MIRLGALTRLSDLRLATRISLGFGAAFALVVLLAVVGLIGLLTVRHDVGAFSTRFDAARIAADIDITMREMEGLVREQLAEGDQDSLLLAGRRRDALYKMLESLAESTDAATDRASTKAARAGLDAYWLAFQKMVGLEAERAQLTSGTLETLINDLRAKLGQLKDAGGVDSAALAADATIGLLVVQERAGRFAQHRDPKDAEEMRAGLDAGRNRLAEMNRYLWVPGTRQLILEVEAGFGQLAGALDALEKVLADEDQLRAEALEPAAGDVLVSIEAVRKRAHAQADGLRDGLAAGTGDWLITVAWIGLGVLVLGLIAGAWIVRSLTRPVDAVATALADLAAGRDAHPNLPALAGRADEIGEIARAVDTIGANAQAMERMKAESAALHDRLLVEKERLEVANAAKADFLIQMGQELHRPLGELLQRTEALMGEAHRLGVGELANDVEMIQWSSERLAGLLDQILDYARIEAGSIDVCVQNFDVGRLLAEVRERAIPLADMNANTLEVGATVGLGAMNTDFTKVRQILMNLLDNACKFTRDGRVRLTAERREEDGLDWLAFTVSDTGAGFAPEQAGRLFQPFIQGGPKDKTPGAGLGLTLVGHYTAQLGGTIEVASEPGRGTRLTIHLPAEYPPEGEERPVPPGGASTAPGRRPLLTVAAPLALAQPAG